MGSSVSVIVDPSRQAQLGVLNQGPDPPLFRQSPGKGMALSEDREVFQAVGTGVGSTGTSMSMLQFHQPEIRVLQHDQGAEMLIREVLRKTGYSPVSFGM
ncbi:hypothetical protein ACF08D_31260, partial [Streptomyces sp. NPDC015131]